MRSLSCIVALAVVAQFAGCADTSRSRSLADSRVTGQVMAEQVCSNCHGQRGLSPSDNFPNLAAQQADYIDGELRSLRDKHRRDPAGAVYMWGIARHLTDAQIAQLAAYYAAQPASPASPPPRDLSPAGKQLFMEGAPDRGLPACASCHGTKGEGNGSIPRLADQRRAYLLRQLNVLRRGPDDRPMGTVMSPVAHQLSDGDMRVLVDFISSM